MRDIQQPSTSAIDSPTGQFIEAIRASLIPLQRLIAVSAITPELLEPFRDWCEQSKQAINEGNAPDWEVLIEVLNGNSKALDEGYRPEHTNLIEIIRRNPKALQVAREACAEFDTYVNKLVQGLVGERPESPGVSPHSIRNSATLMSKVDELRIGVAKVDTAYIKDAGTAITTTPSSATKGPKGNTLAQALTLAKKGGK